MGWDIQDHKCNQNSILNVNRIYVTPIRGGPVGNRQRWTNVFQGILSRVNQCEIPNLPNYLCQQSNGRPDGGAAGGARHWLEAIRACFGDKTGARSCDPRWFL